MADLNFDTDQQIDDFFNLKTPELYNGDLSFDYSASPITKQTFELIDDDPIRSGVPTPTMLQEQSEKLSHVSFENFMNTVPDTLPVAASDGFDFGTSVLPSVFESNVVTQAPIQRSLYEDPGMMNTVPYYLPLAQAQAPPALMQQAVPMYVPHTLGAPFYQQAPSMSYGSINFSTGPVEIPQENPWGSTRLRARPSPVATIGQPVLTMSRRNAQNPRSGSASPVTPNSAPPKRKVRFRREYDAELPKKNTNKDWVRVNTATQGKSSRTGKINNYDAKVDGKYEPITIHPLVSKGYPFGQWHTLKGDHEYVDFKYHRTGELSKHTYSTEELKAFIYNHPTVGKIRLILWIQRAPADSATRYNSKTSSCCRFADCPAKDNNNWTITIDDMRVALDEQWSVYGDRRDPFSVAAFVHLYCLERFLDFADICKRFDVRADDRDLPQEPRGYFAGALNGKQSGKVHSIADEFVKRCKDDTLAFKFLNYPVHSQFHGGAPKPYDKTLCKALMAEKINTMCASKLKLMTARGATPSNLLVHQGDVALALSQGNKGKKAAATVSQKTTIPKLTTVPLIGPVPADRKRKAHAIATTTAADGAGLGAKRTRLPESAEAVPNAEQRGQQVAAPTAPMSRNSPASTYVPIDPALVILGYDCSTPLDTPAFLAKMNGMLPPQNMDNNEIQDSEMGEDSNGAELQDWDDDVGLFVE